LAVIRAAIRAAIRAGVATARGDADAPGTSAPGREEPGQMRRNPPLRHDGPGMTGRILAVMHEQKRSSVPAGRQRVRGRPVGAAPSIRVASWAQQLVAFAAARYGR
jgi:hypothetical protein